MNTRKQEEIDAYLFDKLSAAEKANFHQKIAHDKDLQEDLLLQKEVIQNIQSHGNELLKSNLQAIHQEMLTSQKKQKKPPILLYTLGIACSIVLLISAIFFFNNSNKPNQIAIFSDYYKPYPLSFQTRTTGQLKNKNNFKVQMLYQNQKYSAALLLIEELSLEDPKNPKLLLGKGICYIELKEWDKALTTFDSIIQLKEPFFKDHAIWYAALIHYKIQNFQQTKNKLSILATNSKADHYEDAQRLLKVLENK